MIIDYDKEIDNKNASICIIFFWFIVIDDKVYAYSRETEELFVFEKIKIMNKERLSVWKSKKDYEKIVSIIKNGRLDDFVVGRVLKQGGYTQSPGDDITHAGIVLMYLDAIMTEGYITNQEINDALSKLEICTLLDAWLVVSYISEYFGITTLFHDLILEINVDMLSEKIRTCDKTYQQDSVVQNFIDTISKEYGYNVVPSLE